MLAILLVECHSLLIVSREHHLGATAHAQHSLMSIERLGREAARLIEDEAVERGKHRRIEAHGVFYHEDELHAHAIHVVGSVHLVLDEFDDGHQQVHIA